MSLAMLPATPLPATPKTDAETTVTAFPASANSLLDHVLQLETLRFAWHRVHANGGGAGRDGVGLKRFASLLEYQLLTLAEEVRNGTYQPGPPRRFTVQAGRKRRPIVVLPVRDRVLQRAALDVLTPLVEPTFNAGSFGYRPGRSLFGAVERIVRLRDRGFTWVVDADIEACFASLDHTVLREALAVVVPDPALRDLLSLWIGPPARPGQRPRGIGQGSIVSPLFCNVYLDQMDDSLRKRRYQVIRYADDFVILCKSMEHAERAQRATEKVLRGLRLTLQPAKTRLASFADGFDFLGVRFEGDDYAYVTGGKRIRVDHLPPSTFHDHPDGDY